MKQLEIYKPSTEDDLILASWYAWMVEHPDPEVLHHFHTKSLFAFINRFRPPTILFWSVDEKGVWAAVWFEPAFNAFHVMMWVREDCRRQLRAGDLFVEACDYVFNLTPVIFVTSRLPAVKEMIRKLGAEHLGKFIGVGVQMDKPYDLAVFDRETFRQMWVNEDFKKGVARLSEPKELKHG